jgi:hypothetical protein
MAPRKISHPPALPMLTFSLLLLLSFFLPDRSLRSSSPRTCTRANRVHQPPRVRRPLQHAAARSPPAVRAPAVIGARTSRFRRLYPGGGSRAVQNPRIWATLIDRSGEQLVGCGEGRWANFYSCISMSSDSEPQNGQSLRAYI